MITSVKSIFYKTKFWLNNARVYSLPITILSWVVVFIYSLKYGGNIFNGILALFGIILVHMATNLIDDYFDYKILVKDEKFLKSAQNCKCLYLKTNKATCEELILTIFVFLGTAGLIGFILLLKSGIFVILLAFIGLLVALSYQKLSLIGLGEFAVIFAYGPLLFEGVYYVMTKSFSFKVLLLSLACAFFTNTILYTHMLMDFDGDECSHKTTLCRKLKTKTNALNFILVFYIISFILLAILAYKTNNYFYCITIFTIPLIIDLYKSLKRYNENKTSIDKIHFWHYPLDNWENIKQTEDAPFYFRFFYSRNILTYFMILVCIAIILK